MAKIVSEKPIDDNISVVVLKRDGEAPYTQIISSKISRINKLKRYIKKSHGNKKEYYEEELRKLLIEYEEEQNN